jgi:DNA (cytosine-5)-methyltransferase 1
MTLTFGSLFAGIGGFDLGFERAGMECAWQVEIDPDAQRVLRRHWPDAKLLPDVTKAGRKNLPKVDVICGGFPCQDLSVAGKRAGIKGKRSGLFYHMARITRELKPAVLVWENVPGLLSSERGRCFLEVLAEMDRIGLDGGWTTLDARWFGLAQRRQRVFGVFAFGGAGAELAAEILALRSRRCGHPPPGGEAGQGAAATLRSRSAGPGVNRPVRGGEDDDNLITSHALTACRTASGRMDPNGETFVTHTLRSVGHDASEDGTGRGVPLVTAFESTAGTRSLGAGALCPPLRVGSSVDAPSAPAVAYQCHGNNVGPMGTLRQGNGGTTGGFAANQGGTVIGFNRLEDDFGDEREMTAPTNTAGRGEDRIAVAQGMMVRRLMPVECCRLQGFPDDWLDLELPSRHIGEGWKHNQSALDEKAIQEKLSDSAKYRLLGNAVAVPVAAWLGRQIVKHLPAKEQA